MSVPVTSFDKCGVGVCDARVAAGADPAVQRPAPPEPQIVGTRRRAATSRGHEAAESAHLVPWTPTLSKHGERRRTKRGAVSINRELVTAAMSAPSPAAGVGEDLIAGPRNTPPAPAIATGSRDRSADHRRVNLRRCARMAGQRRASRATWRHRRRVLRRRARRPPPTSWRRLEEVYEALSDQCSVIGARPAPPGCWRVRASGADKPAPVR